MSLFYLFPFWVIAERKGNVVLAILNMAELNLHPRPCPQYSLFWCWNETLISQPTNLHRTLFYWQVDCFVLYSFYHVVCCVCHSLHNKSVYLRIGLRKMMFRRSCKDLHQLIRLEVDGKLIDVPPVEGIIILNILRYLFCCHICLHGLMQPICNNCLHWLASVID